MRGSRVGSKLESLFRVVSAKDEDNVKTVLDFDIANIVNCARNLHIQGNIRGCYGLSTFEGATNCKNLMKSF